MTTTHIPRIQRAGSGSTTITPVGSEDGDPGMRNFQEILANYSVVSAHDEFVVVTPRQHRDPSTAIELADPTVQDLTELGTSGGTMYQHYLLHDYLPELRGIHGLRTYDRMKRSDATVRKSLQLVKTPVLAARWYMEPATDRPLDTMIAEYVWKNLTEDMSITWWQVLFESMNMMQYGHYIFEKVFEPDGGRIKLQKLAPRHPIDVTEWEWDEHGGPNGAWFSQPTPIGRSVGVESSRPHEVFIPIEKLVVFTFDREANNILGLPVLRSTYKHWYFKEQLYKIDAIQKERHGIGIPIIKLPPGFTKNDRKLANEMGRNLRTNERAHVVLPPNWELEFAKIEGNPVNALESIEHHDSMIMGNVLGDFLTLAASRGQSGIEAQWEIFQKSTAFVAEIIRDTFNKWVIPQLVDFNWRVSEYPKLRVRRIGETTDWRTISFALRNFVGADKLRPDEEVENWIRDEMDLPRSDMDTRRDPVTPQAGGARVGPPRQGAPAAGPGNSNAGQDRSG